MYSVLGASQRPLLPTLLRSRCGESFSTLTANELYNKHLGNMASGETIVTGQSVIFVIEGCRRDLNGASGQTAL